MNTEIIFKNDLNLDKNIDFRQKHLDFYEETYFYAPKL